MFLTSPQRKQGHCFPASPARDGVPDPSWPCHPAVGIHVTKLIGVFRNVEVIVLDQKKLVRRGISMVQIIRSLINLRHNRLSVRLMFKILIVTQIMLAPSSTRAQPINSCVCKVLENAEPGFDSELLQSAGDEKPQAKKKKTKSKRRKQVIQKLMPRPITKSQRNQAKQKSPRTRKAKERHKTIRKKGVMDRVNLGGTVKHSIGISIANRPNDDQNTSPLPTLKTNRDCCKRHSRTTTPLPGRSRLGR